MVNLRPLLRIIIFLFIFYLGLSASAGPVTVSGIVCDSLSHEPVPFATVFLKGTDRGVLTDDAGSYSITTSLPLDSIIVSALGYSTKSISVKNRNQSHRLDIDLMPTGVLLGEVIARPKRVHYTKKNNPAVEFMERIRHTEDINDPQRHDNYNYDKYERITIAINDFNPSDSAANGIGKSLGFLKDYVDVSELSGKQVLNISLREKLSSVQYRKSPESNKEYVRGLRSSGFDEILDRQSVQTFYEDVMREVDVYGNDITILQTRFVSPLSRIAPDFYKFYLTDTVFVDTVKCVELTFVPRNPASLGFTGRFYVELGDSTMFIKRIMLRAPHDINLNFIDDLLILQDYVKAPDGSRLKTRDDMMLEASVFSKGPSIYGHRLTVYDGHSFALASDPSLFDRSADIIYAPGALDNDMTFWTANRKAEIGHGANSIEKMMAHLRSIPVYYWGEKTIRLFTSGYVPTGKPSRFDLGPMTTLASYNSVEGLRLKLGGMTTANLSDRWFARGYVARGFKDHRWKYRGELEYSFCNKEYHSREFPVHSIRATHFYDLDPLGQISTMHNVDNVFLSLRRKPDVQQTYHRVSMLEYILETESHFSLEARLQRQSQYSTEYMTFTNGNGKSFKEYTMNSFRLQLRYAPGEKFYQMKTGRLPINMDAPIFTLSHIFAPKGFMGNPFALNVTEASVSKRFWLSAYGCVDVSLKGGHVWSRSPYPDLLIPGANLSYIIQSDLFSCMNPMEFVNDSYAQWDLTYWANGAILNNIPLIKRLKLREAVTFKGIWGHLSDKNKPWMNPELYSFPEVTHTQLMTDRPYMEIGAGLDNIFHILRLDYTWRLTYRDNPGACKSGVRFTFHFSF